MISTEARTWHLSRLQVDRGQMAWLGILVLAALLRLREIGLRPLDPDEAAVALEAFRGIGFGRQWASPEPSSPGYLGLISAVFFLFGSSDVAARLPSVLLGIGMVGLTWFTRPLIGHPGALGAAALLALSPVLVEASRSAQSDVAMIAIVLLLVIAAARIVAAIADGEQVSRLWGYALGGALAAGLATNPVFTLQIVVLAASVIFAFDLELIRRRLQDARGVSPVPALQAFSAVTILYTMRGLTNLGGLQTGLVDPLWVWVRELAAPGRIPAVPLLLLLISETLAVVATLVAVLRISQATPLERFAAAWAAISFGVAIVVGRGDARYLGPPVLAAALVGGPWLARHLSRPAWREPATLVVAAAAAVPLIATLIASLPALRANGALPETRLILAGAAGLAGSLAGAYALAGRRSTLQGALTLALALASLSSVIGLSRLTLASSSDLGQIAPGLRFTADLREVEDQLRIWEWDQDRRSLSVDQRLQPTLGWVLRTNRAVRWLPPEDIRTGPAIKLAASRGEPLPERALRVTVGYRATALVEMSPARLVEWVLWRRPLPRLEPYDILLYR